MESRLVMGLKYQTLDEVRIIPEKLIFVDAYDGKIFNESFTIINAGKYPALVRVLSPTSKAFRMKEIKRGYNLSSGMSISCKIRYTYTRAMFLPHACVPIYINEKPIIYILEVRLSSACVSLHPELLDFGDIDVGNATDQLSVYLTNKGHKLTHFVVDLGRNDLELIVDPMKGTIAPLQSVEIKCELLGCEVGTFMKELWIKTEPPQRVRLTGTFIIPRLMIEHPLTDYSLTLIEFPKTYYGAESTKTVVIRNASSTPTMFCTVAECCGENVCLEKCRQETNSDIKSFYVNPREGRLLAQHKYILKVTFRPDNIPTSNKTCCIVILKIIKLNFRGGIVRDKDVEVKTFASCSEWEHYSIASLVSVSIAEHEQIKFESNCLRVCLYGEIERAGVQLLPDALEALHIRTMATTTFTFNIKNKSKHLPITVRYNKVAGIEMKPRVVPLKPNGSLDVELLLKPTQVGKFELHIMLSLTYYNENNISYDLGKTYLKLTYSSVICAKSLVKTYPHFNLGITPSITNEVGFLVDDVRFNSQIAKPHQATLNKGYSKSNTDLMAFPNDRPQSLRPWKAYVRCTTIFAKIPRAAEDPFDEDKATGGRRKASTFKPPQKKTYSQNTEAEVLEYEVTGNIDRLINEKICRTKFSNNSMLVLESKSPLFIALPPEKLMAIHIEPKFIQLGKIAPCTSCSDSFRIVNTNPFPIHVAIRALSNSVVIKGKKRITIKSNVTQNIFFDCYSHGVGKYYVPVYIIINENHIFDATVFAQVVPMTVNCAEKEIVIHPKKERAFFEISNPVNCDVRFAVEIQDKNFEVQPAAGYIAARSRMTLRLRFVHMPWTVYSTELYLLSQSGAKQIIRACYRNERERIEFNTDTVRFENIPLNATVDDEVIIRNISDATVILNVSNPQPLDWIDVSPDEGLLKPNSDLVLKITVCCKSVISFTCKVEIVINRNPYFVNIFGCVEYPNVAFEPDVIQIPKIISGAYHRRVFRVLNQSSATIYLNFDLANYPEFGVTDLLGADILRDLTLPAGASQELFLEFKPFEPVAYCIYLPYILNGIIGPPQLNDPSSLSPMTYLEKIDNATMGICPDTMPVVKIRCAAGAPWVKFSSPNLNFVRLNEKCKGKFSVQNISTTEQTVTLNCEGIVNTPFTISLDQRVCGNNNKVKLAHTLEPNEKVSYTCIYDPVDFGKNEVTLPIYLDKYFVSCPFNFLKLIGVYPKAVIESNINIIYFPTIPINEKRRRDIHLKFLYHKEDCKLEPNIEDQHIFAKVGEKKMADDGTFSIISTVTFKPTMECVVNSIVTFSCSCGAHCEVAIRCEASTSLLLIYEDFLENNSEADKRSSFPYYPDAGIMDHLNNMRSIVRILEKFVSKMFYSADFFTIPTTICRYPFSYYKVEDCRFNAGKSSRSKYLPLIQLLINLIDDSILKYIFDGKWDPPTDPIQQTVFNYSIYTNIIRFLLVQGVFVQELSPELLMPYKNYVIYKEKLIDNNNKVKDELLTEDAFYLRSKQCWVDLILKIYKVFVFERVLKNRENRPSVYEGEFREYIEINKSQYGYMNEQEATLLMWLMFHFENQKDILWPNVEVSVPKLKSFSSIDIVYLATLTAAYCPYLKNNFKDFYIHRPNQGQQYNNIFIVYQTWQKMNMCLECDIKNIYEPHPIEMLMSLTYLYDLMPYFYPTETLRMEALLGDTSSYTLNVKNSSLFPISYKIIFFSDEFEHFGTDKVLLVIPPRRKRKLKIIYTAKHVLKTDAVLLLSGESGEAKYATSKTFNLVGIPNIFNFSEEHDFKVNMYELKELKFKIKSPYQRSHSSKIYFYFKDENVIPESRDDFVSQRQIKQDHVPKEISFDETIFFDKSGETTLRLKTCFITSGTYVYFIYFLNEEIGDFCNKVTIYSNISNKTVEELRIKYHVPSSVTTKCTCRKSQCLEGYFSQNCPLSRTVDVPYRNRYLMEGLKTMLNVYADEPEYRFWNEHLVFPKGLYIFRHYIENTFDPSMIGYKDILNTSSTYTVEMEDGQYAPSSDPQFIEDVTAEGFHRILIHQNFHGEPTDTFMKLVSSNGREIRLYKLIFTPT